MKRQSLFYPVLKVSGNSCALFAIVTPLFLILLSNTSSVKANDTAFRLALTKTRLHSQKGEAKQALNILEELEKTHQKRWEILSAKADLYTNSGMWKDALLLLEQAQQQVPYNEDIKDRKKQIVLTHAPFISIDRNNEQTGSDTLEQFIRVKGEARYNANNMLGMNLDYNRLRIRSIRRADGRIQTFQGEKQRVEIYLRHEYAHGDTSKLSLFLAQGVVGIGAEHKWLDLQGHTTLQIALQKPDWDFIQSVLDKGSKDSIKLSRFHRLAPQTTGNLSAALNRYGIDGESTAVTSSSIEGNIGYGLPQYAVKNALGHHAAVSLNYLFDAEYPFAVSGKIDGTGARYEPLPLASSEIHSVNINIGKEFSKELRTEGFGGYSYDRLGEGGLTFGGLISYRPKDTLEIQLKTSRSVSTQNTGQTQETFGFNITQKF